MTLQVLFDRPVATIHQVGIIWTCFVALTAR